MPARYLPLTLALLLCLTSVSLTGCGSSATAAAGPRARPPAPIRLTATERKKVAPRITVLGNVRPARTSVVASGNAGIVDAFPVREGQYVEEGAVLSVLRMATTDLEIAEQEALLKEREAVVTEMKAGYRKQEIEEAEARLIALDAARKSTAAKHNRADGLKARGAITQEEYDEAEEHAIAASNLYLAQSKLVEKLQEGYRKTEIEQAEARLEAQARHVDYLIAEKEKRTTKAPFNGYVVKEHTHEGQFLSLGSPIVTLAWMDEVDIVVPVDELDIGLIHPGAAARVRLSSEGAQEFQGEVVAIVPQSEWQSGSRGFPVKVRLKNQFQEINGRREPRFKEGMTAEVTFQGEERDALLIPKDAIIRGSTGAVVYVFLPLEFTVGKLKPFVAQVPGAEPLLGSLLDGPDTQVVSREAIVALAKDHPVLNMILQGGQARPQPVIEGLSDGDWIEDRSGGIALGDRVVVEGGERLQPFQNVQVLPPKEAPPSPGK